MSDPLNIPHLSPQIPRLGNRFSQWLGKSVLKGLGWRFDGEFPIQGKVIIIVAPHTSNWDFVIGLAVVFCLRLKISFFGKHSIFIPPFDRLLKRWGGIPIERSQAHGVVSQISQEMQKADKMILCLAPEGTRSKITHWKKGFMHIARETSVPVFMVGLNYRDKLIELGPQVTVNGDVEQEMAKVYGFYAKVPAKFPDKFSYPTENALDD